jgi:predicted cupin superfamily sugar epimerase
VTETFTGEETADLSWVALSTAGRSALGGLPPTASAAEVAEALGLEPHREGGCFRETYRSPITVETNLGMRSLATAIVYLLSGSDSSRFHRLRSDEIWFFHAGSRAEMVMLERAARGEGRGPSTMLGREHPQVVVPAGTWLGVRVAPGQAAGGGPDWTLASCVVMPGFEYEDFELAERDALLREFPEAADIIRALT